MWWTWWTLGCKVGIKDFLILSFLFSPGFGAQTLLASAGLRHGPE